MVIFTGNYLKSLENCEELVLIGQGLHANDGLRYFTFIEGYDLYTTVTGFLFGKKHGGVDFFWIPRCEEIIYLIRKENLKKYEGMSDFKLDVFLRTVLSRHICCGGWQRLSYNEMWLQFYMIEVHKKRWMGSPEVWANVKK